MPRENCNHGLPDAGFFDVLALSSEKAFDSENNAAVGVGGDDLVGLFKGDGRCVFGGEGAVGKGEHIHVVFTVVFVAPRHYVFGFGMSATVSASPLSQT